MIDKKTETGIKTLKSFLEFWSKFHSIYSEVSSKGLISKDDEAKFLETRGMIKDKYTEVRDSLEFKYAPRARLTDPVSDVLALENLRFMSEKLAKKIEEDWKDSYVFLDSILERLENNRRRMERFSPIGVFVKRVLDRR